MSKAVSFWSKSWGQKFVSFLAGGVLIILFCVPPAQAQDTCQYVLGDINGGGEEKNDLTDYRRGLLYYRRFVPASLARIGISHFSCKRGFSTL